MFNSTRYKQKKFIYTIKQNLKKKKKIYCFLIFFSIIKLGLCIVGYFKKHITSFKIDIVFILWLIRKYQIKTIN